MKGQLMELLFYPYLMGVLLFTFHFFSRSLISNTTGFELVVNESFSAIDSSNLALLNCSMDHIIGDCRLPEGDGVYFIRRLALVNGEVKELIYPAVR